MQTDNETVSQPEDREKEVFGKLTASQARYVRLWIQGGKGKADCYREAYRGGKGPITGSIRSCACSTHRKPKVQAAIHFLCSKENKSAVLTRQEKREFLAHIVRAHTPQMRAIEPGSPYLKHDPIVALTRDNEMAGHNVPTEITGDVTIGAILADLRSSPMVNEGQELPKLVQPHNGDPKPVQPSRVPALERFKRVPQPKEDPDS